MATMLLTNRKSSIECYCCGIEFNNNFILHTIEYQNTSSTMANVPSSFEVSSVNERTSICMGCIIMQIDAYLAIPCSKMAVDEYKYYGISYHTFNSDTPSVILLVACENETVVKFDSSTIFITQ